MGSCNVAGLPLLGSAGQQDHESLAVGTIVDAVPGTEVDSKLRHAFANLHVIAEVSKFEPVDPRLDARPNLAALALQPLAKVVRTVLCHVVDDVDQDFIVAYWLQDFVAIARAHAVAYRRFPVLQSAFAPALCPRRTSSVALAIDAESAELTAVPSNSCCLRSLAAAGH